MNTTRIMIVGALFLVTLLSGIGLSHLGRPLNTAVFTIHKLIALGTVILLGMEIYGWRRSVDINAPSLIVAIFCGLLVLLLFASGALMSAGRPASLALLTVHRVAPPLLTVSFVAVFYLLRMGGVR